MCVCVCVCVCRREREKEGVCYTRVEKYEEFGVLAYVHVFSCSITFFLCKLSLLLIQIVSL